MSQQILDHYQSHFDHIAKSLSGERTDLIHLLHLSYAGDKLEAQLNHDHPWNKGAALTGGRTFTDFTWTLLGTRMTFTTTDLQGWGDAIQVAMIYIQLGMPIYYESAIFEPLGPRSPQGQMLDWVAHRCNHLWPAVKPTFDNRSFK